MTTLNAREQAILTTISSIPKGYLCTYGLVAETAGYPGCARLVGRILKHLPEGSRIPWFRVINSQGKISFPEGSPNYKRQSELLFEEGHPKELGLAHLKRYLWPPKL